MQKRAPVNLKLDFEDAITIYDLVCRLNESGAFSRNDPVDQQVMHNLECYFETELLEIFSSNYNEIVANCRAQIATQYGVEETDN